MIIFLIISKSVALAQLLVKELCFQFEYYIECFPSVQICEQMRAWNMYWDDQQMVPYGCKGNQFVGYDDIQSTIIKVHSHTNKFYHM
jgi:hypothetical protein